MIVKRTRTEIDPLVRAFIEEEARADEKAKAKIIWGRVNRRLKQERLDFPLPKVRAIQVIAKNARAVPGPSLDDPWHLGLQLSQIQLEANGDLLAVWKLSNLLGLRFTIRQAIWVSKLRATLQGESPRHLLIWSRIYSRRESATVRGQLPDTRDLDAELAYRPWKSNLHQWEYDQAVLSGVISSPNTEPRNGILSVFLSHYILEDEFIRLAREFLKVGSDYQDDEKSWWPHAESAMIYWLREVSRLDETWSPYLEPDFETVEPEERQDWQDEWESARDLWEDLGERLAEVIITKAKELDQGAIYQGGWIPQDILEEVDRRNSSPSRVSS